MRTITTAALAAIMLSGCTIIPAAETHRHPPQPAASAPTPPPYSDDTPPGSGYPDPQPAQPSLTYASLGQTVSVGGPRITPMQVLEDSRCPMNARCVWAGQVRLLVRIESGRGGQVELTSGKPVSVADGMLELVEVRPDKVAGGTNGGAIAPAAYRFGFRFAGGL